MPREGIEKFEDIYKCEILDKFNLTELKVTSVFIKPEYVRFNMAAIRLLDETPYVEIFFNKEEQYMLVVPCGRYDVHAIDWCKINKKTGKTEPRELRNKGLSPKLYRMMGWDKNLSYKVQCYYQDFGGGKCLLYFDLRVSTPMITTDVVASTGTTRRRTIPVQLVADQEFFGPKYQDLLSRVNQEFAGVYLTETDNDDGDQQMVLFGRPSKSVTDTAPEVDDSN